MTNFDPDFSDMQRAVRGAPGLHWRFFLFQGVVMVLLGILAVGAPFAAAIAVGIYTGWLFLINGIVGLVAIFSAKDAPAFLWGLLTAALSVVVRVLLIGGSVQGVLSLSLSSPRSSLPKGYSKSQPRSVIAG